MIQRINSLKIWTNLRNKKKMKKKVIFDKNNVNNLT